MCHVKHIVLFAVAWSLISSLRFDQENVGDSSGETPHLNLHQLADLEQSAKGGGAEAQAMLGDVYALGIVFVGKKLMKVPKDLPKDYGKALKSSRKAAEQGD